MALYKRAVFSSINLLEIVTKSSSLLDPIESSINPFTLSLGADGTFVARA